MAYGDTGPLRHRQGPHFKTVPSQVPEMFTSATATVDLWSKEWAWIEGGWSLRLLRGPHLVRSSETPEQGRVTRISA